MCVSGNSSVKTTIESLSPPGDVPILIELDLIDYKIDWSVWAEGKVKPDLVPASCPQVKQGKATQCTIWQA